MKSDTSSTSRRHQTSNKIYRYIYDSQDFCSRQSLSRDLNLSLPTVYQHLSELMAAGLVQDSGELQSTGGGKASGLSIVPDARTAIGISVTENQLRISAADLRLNELAYREIPIETIVRFADLGSLLPQVIEQFRKDFSISSEHLLGVGIALPAVMSPDSRYITAAPTLHLKDTSVEGLTAQIPYPTYVENDATCAGYAEWFLHGTPKDMAYLSLEDGVGGAILLGSSPYIGENRRSAEFGHMCVEPGGLRCSCGRQGCLEAYCSPRRLQQESGCTLQEFFRKVECHDSGCTLLWENTLRHLAFGIYNIRMALDCNIILGGFLTEYLVPYFPRLREYAAALNPFESTADYLHLSVLRKHTISLGVSLHFVVEFLKYV